MIARHLVIVCLIYAALVLQTTAASDFATAGFQPWWPGIVLVMCLVLTDGMASLLWVGLLGLAVDFQSAERPGVHLVLVTLIASGLNLIRSDRQTRGTFSIGAFVFGGTLIWRTAAPLAHAVLDHHSFVLMELVFAAICQAACSAVVMVFLLASVRLGMNALRNDSMSSVGLDNQWSMLNEK